MILTLIAPLGAAHLDDGNGTPSEIFYIASVLLLAAAASGSRPSQLPREA